MKATRNSFGEELAALGETQKNIVVLDADLSKSTQTHFFAKKFPERFFEMGIAESNMIGTASGLALSGKVAFACSFGSFLTGRFDQIRMSVSYNNANVKLIGTHAGIGIGEDGHSQMGLEDVALMRTMPNMHVYQPADDVETRSLIRHVVKESAPCYIRLTRQKVANVHAPDYEFKLGKWQTLFTGKKVAVIGTGGLVCNLVEARKLMNGTFTLVSACSLKPADTELVKNLASTHDLIITVEDHYIVGGLGTIVSEVMAESGASTKLVRLGVKDFGESGTPEELYDHYRFDAKGLAAQLSEIL